MIARWAPRLVGIALLLAATHPAFAAPYLYLTDTSNNSVDVIDTHNDTTLKVIPVGNAPTVATLSQDARRLFVLNRSDATLSIIDTRELNVIATYPVGPTPYELDVSPDATRFYVISGGSITQYSASNGQAVCSTSADENEDFTLSPDGTRLYGADYFHNLVRDYDAGTCISLPTIDPQLSFDVESIAVSADSKTLYAISLGTLSIVRVSDGTVLAHVVFGSEGGESGPTIVVSPDGKYVYATSIDGDYIAAINLSTYGVTQIFLPANRLPGGVAISANGSRLYVPGYPNGTTEISTQTNQVIRTFGESISSTGVRRGFLGAPRPTVYVAESGANRISVINAATQAIEKQIPVGNAPSSISVAGDALHAYVTNQTDNTVSVVGAVTQSVLGTWPTGNGPVASEVTLDGKTLYVANTTDKSLNVIGTPSGNAIETIALQDGGLPVNAMGLSANGASAYVVAYSGLCVVQTATNSYPGGCVDFGPYIGGVATSPDSSTLYLTSSWDGTLMVDDPTNVEVAAISVGPTGPTTINYYPTALAVSPEGDYVYVANTTDNSVSVIDTVTRTANSVIGVGTMPVDLRVTPDGRFVYVANKTDGSISVIDTTTNSVVQTITGLSSPSAIGNIVEPFRDAIFQNGFEN